MTKKIKGQKAFEDFLGPNFILNDFDQSFSNRTILEYIYSWPNIFWTIDFNHRRRQAKAEVVPSSSLVEVEVGVEVRCNEDELRCNLVLILVVVSTFTGGWSEDWRVMLKSTQDQIKLKLKF